MTPETKVQTGLENLKFNFDVQDSMKGNVGFLCHGSSVDSKYHHGIFILKAIYGNRLKKLFSPQHGLVGDAQDNMIESDHIFHPYFKLPVYSLYSETRSPTDEMLDGLDHLIVDFQDVGTRVYTYIHTLTLLMKACGQKAIQVVLLDRPNPINGEDIEGNILDQNFASFIGMHPLPMRHALTIGEIALMAKQFWNVDCQLRVITMNGWKRWMSFEDTHLPWVLPSPNLSNIETAYAYPGTVLFEGTNLSEGRGTTKSLELIGHPNIDAYYFLADLENVFKKSGLRGFIMRPTSFTPTFQKFKDISCGGYQIHVTDKRKFKPWKVGQILCREFRHYLGENFQWNSPPYEYEYEKLPIDILNGTDKLRKWVENKGEVEELEILENEGHAEYLDQRSQVLLYE